MARTPIRIRIDCPLSLVPPFTETGSLPRSDQANRFLFATRDRILLWWLELAANRKETRSGRHGSRALRGGRRRCLRRLDRRRMQ